MAKFGTDWSIFADVKSVNKVKYGKFSYSSVDNLNSSRDKFYNRTHPSSSGHIHFDQVWC